MSQNTQEIRTLAYVLRRTNYGEADRIINFLTPNGKISAIAKSARKEKSKLAGGIEMFCLSDINVHQGNSDLGTLTSAKMLKFHSNLMTDIAHLELASLILKKVNLAIDNSDSEIFFKIVDQSLTALNAQKSPSLVEAWFWLNFAKACGEEVNLFRDTEGQKLNPDTHYIWDIAENALRAHPNGDINADAIKLMRLMLASDFSIIARVKNVELLLPPILFIARAVNKI